jgi:glutamine synthetase
MSDATARMERGDFEYLRQAVTRLVDEGGLEAVGVGASDFNGIFRGKMLPAERFVANIEDPLAIGDMFFVFDPAEGVAEEGPGKGWWPLSDEGFREMRCRPLPETFRMVPWRDRTGLVLCDFAFTDGTEVGAAPRKVLERVVARARELGYEPFCGYELEFYLLRESAGTLRSRHWQDLAAHSPRAQGWSMLRAGLDDDVLRPLRDGLRDFGIPVEAWAVEGGAGQYEINVPYATALEAADRAFLHRFAIKEIAARHGCLATFMARPPGMPYGSSLHLHQSLWTPEGDNAFHEAADGDRLSELARSFVAGLLANQYELAALYAPNVNSYKRLLPGMSSGGNATWGFENWSTGVRVIATSPSATRVEFRSPGADANPYLAIAAALAAGLDGIERGATPPAASRGDASASDARRVPRGLHEAITALEGSAMARGAFGEQFLGVYAATRRAELDAFQRTVSDWEAERYLEAL